MSFANPLALALLVVIPYFAWLGWPRVSYRRRRDIASLLIRLAIVIMIIFGLSGLQVIRAADKLSVVFLIDASDSIDQGSRQQAEQYIRDAMSKMSPEDRAGVVVFGKNALVERPVSTGKELSPITSVPIRLDTNIAGAIRLALAMFPADTAKRIVILSDGVETLDSATEAAKLAAATNVQIDAVPLRRQQGPEVLVTNVEVPTTFNQGQVVDLGVTVESQTDTPANLTILSAGAVIQTSHVQLKTGTNNFVVSLSVPKTGFVDFDVRVDPPGPADTFYQNNELAAFSEVTGPPRVLVVSDSPDEIAPLLPALQGQGIEVDVQKPADLPIGLAPLATYKSVVMANIPATDLSEQRMKVLQSYVRDLGGGLVVLGGPNSFGPGGYFQTPLEEALPVESRIKDQKRIPKLLMVYVIDRSGSMETIEQGNSVTNLELAKEAARRSIELLFPQDRAGVLSFDSNPQWLVPIQNVNNKADVERQIGQLRPGGGTDILAAVQIINQTVPQDEATLKHVILLTDGGADPTGIVQLVQDMNQKDKITVTSVGIGSAVPSFMKDIATAGGGIYYNVTNVANLPQVFAADTVLATRSYIVENEFTPQQSANSTIMQGVSASPSLLGYVATTAKQDAAVVLTAPGYNDPLLATWQYGLGRSVAWTSDANGRWAKNWTSWENYGRFFSQMVRYTITEGTNTRIDSHVEQRNGRSVLVVDARDENGHFLNSLDLTAAVVDPKLQNQGLKLRQVAPGRYEAEFDPANEGAYFIRVGGTSTQPDNNAAVAQTTGWVMTYSPEYRLRDTNMNLLEEITRLTGGNLISDKSDIVFLHNIKETNASSSLWPYLLLLVTVLLPADIAVRRLMVTQSDLQKLGSWTREKLGLNRERDTSAATSGRLTRLKDAKDRAASTVVGPDGNVAPGSTISALRAQVERSEANRKADQDTVSAVPDVAPSSAPKQPYTPPAPSASAPSAANPTPPVPRTEPRPTSPLPDDDDPSGSLASKLLKRRSRGE